MLNKNKRPLLRYHGGKWKLAPWIISYFPPHKIYTEPFGGAGSVLLQKPEVWAEIYNDLDDEIVNLFQVMREHGRQLIEKIRLTPFSRTEFMNSYKKSDDPVEQARRTVLRSFQGFGSLAAAGKNTGFRANSNSSGRNPSHDFTNLPNCLDYIIDRLKSVVIENRDAMTIIKQHDTPDTLHYLDPPYVHSTRDQATTKNGYNYEMTDDDHIAMAKELESLKGMVVLSGYTCDLYDELYSNWHRIDRHAFADGAKPRVESLWLNKAAYQQQRQGDLFAC